MTVDEELNRLEDNIRRLKIEFETYFNGGKPRPPNDMLYRVEQALKKHSSDATQVGSAQRFRFNQLLQRYTVYSDFWRKRLRDKEEGRELSPRIRGTGPQRIGRPARVVCSDPDHEQEKVEQLLAALVEAKQRAGQRADDIDPVKFRMFVRDKTLQLKETLGCEKVQFCISIEDGRVKFTTGKAK